MMTFKVLMIRRKSFLGSILSIANKTAPIIGTTEGANMRNPFKKEKSDLDVAIADVHARMREVGPDDEEYRQLVVYLDRLMTMKTAEKQSFKVTPDTIAIIVGNLVVALIIVNYEREHVVATKALDFVLKRKSV